MWVACVVVFLCEVSTALFCFGVKSWWHTIWKEENRKRELLKNLSVFIPLALLLLIICLLKHYDINKTFQLILYNKVFLGYISTCNYFLIRRKGWERKERKTKLSIEKCFSTNSEPYFFLFIFFKHRLKSVSSLLGFWKKGEKIVQIIIAAQLLLEILTPFILLTKISVLPNDDL